MEQQRAERYHGQLLYKTCNYCYTTVKANMMCFVYKCGQHLICGNCLKRPVHSSKTNGECEFCPKVTPAGKHCNGCNSKIETGVAHVYPECGKCVYCKDCFFGSGYVVHDCIECRSQESIEYESKNSLSLLLSMDGIIQEGERDLKYRYPSLHVQNTIYGIVDKGQDTEVSRRLGVLNLGSDQDRLGTRIPHVSSRGLCRTDEPNTVLALGEDSSYVHVLTTKGIQVTHKLYIGDNILSSACILRNMFSFVAGNKDENGFHLSTPFTVHPQRYEGRYKYKVHLVQLEVTSSTPTILTTHFTLDVKHQPIHLFNMSKQRLGLLSRNEYYDTKERMHSRNLIRIYTLDTILRSNSKNEEIIQSDVLWGKRVFELERSDGDWRNTTALTPSGFICLSQYEQHNVCVYSKHGVFLLTLGREWDFKRRKGGTFRFPTSLQCTGRGEIVVFELWGGIHIFTPYGTFRGAMHDDGLAHGGKLRAIKKWVGNRFKTKGKKKISDEKNDDEQLSVSQSRSNPANVDSQSGRWRMVGLLHNHAFKCIITENNIWCVHHVKVYDGGDGKWERKVETYETI